MAQRENDSWKDWWDRVARRLKGDGDRSEGDGDSDGGNSKRVNPPKTLLLVALLGLGLMVLGDGLRDRRAGETGGGADEAALTNAVVSPARSDYADYIDELEREVTVALTQAVGVGNAKVVIVPRTSEINVLAEEVTESRSRSPGTGEGETIDETVTRRPVIVRNDADEVEEPVIRYTEKPKIAGVLVVADGASDARVRWLLLEAVSTLLDVAPHRVQIVPRK